MNNMSDMSDKNKQVSDDDKQDKNNQQDKGNKQDNRQMMSEEIRKHLNHEADYNG
jgi:hypothetical protein